MRGGAAQAGSHHQGWRHRRHRAGGIAAATGLGIGKTQLATEFVDRYGQFLEGGVFWISFSDPAAVPAEVASCGGAGYLDLRPDYATLPIDDQVRLVRAAWESDVPRLLVFDNCEARRRSCWRSGGCVVAPPAWSLPAGGM